MKRYIYHFTLVLSFLALLGTLPVFATKHVVQVGNFFFSPASLNVTVGDTIRWVWVAGGHTTTSTPGAIPAGAASWDELINSSNTSYEYKVTVEGSYSYVCTPHAPGMAGTFIAAGFSPTLSVTPSNRNVNSSSGTTTFTVTSNSVWTAGCSASWCTINSSGSGNGVITANYSSNTSVNQRVATITVMVTGLPDQTVTVTQAGAQPTLAVAPSNQNVSAAAGSAAFNITSNTIWQASCSESWCTVTPSGNGNGILTASFTENLSTSLRTASISVTVSGLPVQIVTVTQAASTVGIGEQKTLSLEIYPNPSKGNFKIRSSGDDAHTYDVTIMDISGKTILSGQLGDTRDYSFNLSGFPRGYYFVRIKSDAEAIVKRLVLVD